MDKSKYMKTKLLSPSPLNTTPLITRAANLPANSETHELDSAHQIIISPVPPPYSANSSSGRHNTRYNNTEGA